jgi:CcmD family protein
MADVRVNTTGVRWILAVVVCAAALWAPVLAQQPPTPDGFVPMSEVTNREVLPATPLVFYAYAFVWVALMGYLWVIWRRIGQVEQDLAAVTRRLSQSREGR